MSVREHPQKDFPCYRSFRSRFASSPNRTPASVQARRSRAPQRFDCSRPRCSCRSASAATVSRHAGARFATQDGGAGRHSCRTRAWQWRVHTVALHHVPKRLRLLLGLRTRCRHSVFHKYGNYALEPGDRGERGRQIVIENYTQDHYAERFVTVVRRFLADLGSATQSTVQQQHGLTSTRNR